MLRLYIQAPFAAFRTFAAGWYRPTAGFVTPSAAYGLALNLAGIETRRDDGLSAMTLTRFILPPARIALGADPENPRGPHPAVQTLYQQLHNYPVGTSGKERKDDAKGNKYNITPVRREFLTDLRAYICLDFFEEPAIEDRIRRVLSGESPESGNR
jgi:CRISPR-associated protein Cas5t